MYQNALVSQYALSKTQRRNIQKQIEEEEIIGRKHEGRKIPRQICRL